MGDIILLVCTFLSLSTGFEMLFTGDDSLQISGLILVAAGLFSGLTFYANWHDKYK